MRTRLFSLSFIALLITLSLSAEKTVAQTTAPPEAKQTTSSRVPAPEDVLGFRPGDDRKLASWASIVEYFKRLDEGSDRVVFEELGRTTMNAPFVLATISAPDNLRRLSEFKEIQARLADPRKLGKDADKKAKRLISQGKTIVLITCGIHSTEVGSTLSSMLIAHRLASSNEPLVQDILRDTIILLVPSLNPDGVDIVKNWYDKTLGTPFEGTDPPVLYHKYVGHDNNRDWYAFTQVETQITVDKIHNVWHPQIVHDIHQMGRNGARLFLPPYLPPVEPNVPRQIVEGYTELGRAMANELRDQGLKGVVTDAIFDAWTPARAYSHYHAGVRILSETASARLATPVQIKFEELRPREGESGTEPAYDPRKASTNFPEVWPGGEWRLRDITNYMTSAAFSLLKHASRERERWLSRFYEIGKEAVRERKAGEVFAFIIPPLSEDKAKAYTHSWNYGRLEGILRRGGVEIDRVRSPKSVDAPTGADEMLVIPMAQPYGAFAKALLEVQRYPNLRDSSGAPIQPYDVTAHTLPLLMGVEVQTVTTPFSYSKLMDARGWGGGHGVEDLRFAIYKSHMPSMDEGWTRWIIDTSKEFKRGAPSLLDNEARAGNLYAKYDTIIIPDQSPRAILNGHRPGSMPEEFTGGLGAEGVKSLREFIEAGGTLVLLNRASRFGIEQFDLPVRDITRDFKRTEFYVPGSILRIELDPTQSLARGLPKESIAWVEDSPVFEIKSDPAAIARVRIIARYPETTDPLLSGWLFGGERIKGKAALVEVVIGKGRIYLFGFRPQYRAQSSATFHLLFSAIRQASGN